MSDDYIETGWVALDNILSGTKLPKDGEIILFGGTSNSGRSLTHKIITEFSYDDIKPSDHLVSDYKVGVAVLSEDTTKIYDGEKYLSIPDFFYMWNKDDFHIDRNTLIVKETEK